MLKLIYHNPVFGPIDLEFERPIIRVGRSEDNDLVLRHPSVEPHHCVLVFRDGKLVWLAANVPGMNNGPLTPTLSPSEGERENPSEQVTGSRSLAGPEFGPGDHLQIGELLFNVQRSSQSVAIPAVRMPQANAEPSASEAQSSTAESRNRYFCPKCRVVYQSSDLKRVGLVGHSKRLLCPKCSHVFEVEPEPPKPVPVQAVPSPKGWFHRSTPTQPPTTQPRT